MTPEELKAWRIKLNLTQAEAARALRVAASAYQHWEYGRRVMPGPAIALAEIIAQPSLAVLRYQHLHERKRKGA